MKVGGLELAVKGVTFGNRQEALKRLAAYSPELVQAVLVAEPTNPVDPAAVAVWKTSSLNHHRKSGAGMKPSAARAIYGSALPPYGMP